MNSNDLIVNVGKNSNDTAALVWSVADDLVGAYKPHEYGLVILPMTVIKRFHDCLLPTHQAVLDTYKMVFCVKRQVISFTIRVRLRSGH